MVGIKDTCPIEQSQPVHPRSRVPGLGPEGRLALPDVEFLSSGHTCVASWRIRRPAPKSEPANTNSLFQEPWWLEALAPGHWAAAEVPGGDGLVGRMPYVFKKKFGIPIITQPKLTPMLGPWIKPSDAKYANRLGQQKDIIESLLEQLPRHYYCCISCHPSVTNLVPFYWAGFELQLVYTYRLNDLSDPDRIWAGFLKNIRGYIRKAQKTLVVRDDLGLDAFLDVNEMTFRRQNTVPPYSRDLVRRLDRAAGERGRRRILFAVDADGHVHAATYLVWDEESTYNLMSGGDPVRRHSGATSLLMWHAIQHAATVSEKFDFEGSMIEPVERFFRAFGAVQTPYYRAVRMHPLLKCLLAAKDLLRRHPR
jgi:hypothetical protein